MRESAPTPAVSFRPAAEDVGPSFVHSGEVDAPGVGPGVALFDVDGDGDLDLYVVDGIRARAATEDGGGESEPATSAPSVGRLFEWRQGRFEDVTASWGLEDARYEQRGTGVCAADWDGDGDVDLFTTANGANRLLSNEGRSFRDVTEQVGLNGVRRLDGTPRFDASTSAAFCDFDGDGRLDLVVCRRFPAGDLDSPCRIWRNRPDGRFGETTKGSGADGVKGGALAVSLFDLDRDGRMALLLAMESGPPLLLRNKGAMRFENASAELAAFATSGSTCVDATSVADDAGLALAIGALGAAPLHLVRLTAEGTGRAEEETGLLPADALESPVRALTFLDADLDGVRDLLLLDESGTPSLLLAREREQGGAPGYLRVRSGRTADGLPGDPVAAAATVGGSFACGDVNGDGIVDVVTTERGGPARLWLGEFRGSNRGLRIDLRAPGSNRSAIGAKVTLVAPGRDESGSDASGSLDVDSNEESPPTVPRPQTAWVRTGQGALSQHETTLTFGLGLAASVDVLVRWPDGTSSEHPGLSAGSTHVLTKPGL